MPNNLADAEEIRLLDLSLLDTDLLALCTTQPTDSAAGTEVVGGTYARQTLTWAAADSSGKANSAALSFTGMPAADVTAWEIYDEDGTTRKWWGLFNTLQATAQNSGDTITSASHGLLLNQKIVFQAGYVPTPLTAGTIYYVRTVLTNTFQVSATAGGAALAITADNSNVVVGRAFSTLAGDGLSVAAGAVVCTLD